MLSLKKEVVKKYTLNRHKITRKKYVELKWKKNMQVE